MEFRFSEPPRETKIGSKNREVREIAKIVDCLTEEGKQLLVRVIGRFEKMRVREIWIPLYYSIYVIIKHEVSSHGIVKALTKSVVAL